MTLDEAKAVLEKDRPEMPYISTHGGTAILDGDFCIEQLEALLVIMKHQQEAQVTAE